MNHPEHPEGWLSERPSTLAAMNLYALRETIEASETSDWQLILDEGGSFFRYKLTPEPTDSGLVLDATAHTNHAVLINDLDISISWGLDPYESSIRPDRQLSFPWVQGMMDDSTFVLLVDVFYRGTLVERVPCVGVDGSNAFIPVPHRTATGQLFITKWQFDLGRVVNALAHGSQSTLAEYLDRLGITVN